jgi:PAS domain S-box-containing protein
LGEELAIDLLKQGATDYVLKSRLPRLPIEVSRALREVQERKERDQAQATLRQTEELLRKVATAVEQAAEGVMITNNEGKVEYVNPAFTRISGYADGDPTGQDYAILRSGHHAQTFYDAIWRTLKAGEVWKGRLVRKKKDGSAYDVEETISPVKDSCGAVVNYVFVSRDMTEQVRLEQQLRQAQKIEALGTLTGGIAHDFNNILAAMMGFAQLANDRALKGSRQEHHLQMVLDAGLRGRELVKQMLTFSRKTEQEREPLQLSSVVQEAMNVLRPLIPSTIGIRIKIDGTSGLILADPTQIQQILVNLVTNAAHAMREKGGTLDIELSECSVPPSNGSEGMKPGLYVRLMVRDTGVGIPTDIIGKIFDPFFTTKKQGEGTGLGLSVVHGIVKQHDGYITVESEPGKGSIFTIHFPKVEEQPKVRTVDEESIPTGSERILFIDDENALVEMEQEMLTGLGYLVVSKNNSREALAILRLEPSRFDLVVTDETMPDMTGVELAKELLAIRSDIPIILCTGFSDEVNKQSAKAAGIKAFAMKPLTKGEIARTIRKVLDE